MKKLILTVILVLSIGSLTLNSHPVGVDQTDNFLTNMSVYGPVGGKAPIGGGITLMIALVVAYGIKRHQLHNFSS